VIVWEHEYTRLSAANARTVLASADLERLATAAYLTGRDVESLDVYAKAFQLASDRGDTLAAVRAAFWQFFLLYGAGENARAFGWSARARRLLEDSGVDCVERGFLLLPVGLRHVADREIPLALAAFEEAARLGDRFKNVDLICLARQGQGRGLIAIGRLAEGVALLDEVMVSVTAGEPSPMIAGVVYCSVISSCFERFDLKRAQEWTEALRVWCDDQPGLVAYRGSCQIYRAEILRLHGEWPEAIAEAERASEAPAPFGTRAGGESAYQQAEVHRLRGDFATAEQGYRRAADAGRAPYPGLALLRLAQGQVDAAAAAIRRVIGEPSDTRTRCVLLPAAVDVLLAAGDVAAARLASDELNALAAQLNAPVLLASAAHATGAVALASDECAAGLRSLRHALAIWRDLGAPYDAARTQVLIAESCQRLGDAEGGRIERDAAAHTFRDLGASADLAALDRPAPAIEPLVPAGLTLREVEVLRLMATGRTNRAIATALDISEKTVARHVSNIFVKLGVNSRSAATAYAFTHDLA
jgi:DNA-binding CsgD family transcriptional regulator